MFCTRCPAGWQQFDKTCYYFSTEGKSWVEARAACSMLGAQLAIINSELENVSCTVPQKQPRKTPNTQNGTRLEGCQAQVLQRAGGEAWAAQGEERPCPSDLRF